MNHRPLPNLTLTVILLPWLWMLLTLHPLMGQRQLSLDECRAAAAAHYALDEQMKLVESAAAARQMIWRKLITPEAGGFATASYQSDVPRLSSTDDFGIDYAPLGRDQYRTGIYARQVLFDGGEYRSRNALEDTERKINESMVERRQRILENAVDELFLSTILLNKGLLIIQAREEILQTRLRQLEALFSEGKVYRVELLEMEAALSGVWAQQEALLADKERFRHMLSSLTGLPIAPEDSLLLPDMQLTSNRKEDPIFRQLKLNKQKIHQTRQLSRASAMPRLDAAVLAGYARPGLNFLSNDFDTYWIVGMTLKVPITGWRDHQRTIRTLTVEESQLSIHHDNLRKQEALLLAELDGEVDKYSRLILQDAALIEKHTLIRMEYEAMLTEGVASASDLLQALSAESQVRLSKARHEIELVRASLKRNHAIIEQPTQ